MKYSARTTEIYIGHLRRFSSYIKNKDIQQVLLYDDVLGYMRHLERRGINDSTINLAMIALRQLWKIMHGMERQIGIQLPFMVVMIPVKSGVVARSHKPIDEADFTKLLEAIQENAASPFMRLRDQLIFRMLYDTGVRVSELTALDVTSLNLERRSAKVITRKRRDAIKFRETFWTFETHHLLMRYLEHRSALTHDAQLFINMDDGGRITPRSIQRLLKAHLKQAKIDPSFFSPHSFRHSVGKRAAQEQMYPPLLQSLLGHRNPNSSQIYYNIQNESLRHEYHTKLGDMRSEKVIERLTSSTKRHKVPESSSNEPRLHREP